MLSSKTQSLLAEFLKSVAEAEISVEITRLVLAEKKDFDLHNAFCHIDKLSKGYINVEDIVEFLEEVDIVAQDAQIRYFFYLYDSDDDFKLSFSDFKNAFLPTTDRRLRENAANRTVGTNQSLSYAASWALARVFEKEIQAFSNLESKREILITQRDWEIKAAFNCLDDQQHMGYINKEGIDIFFKNNHQISTLNEIDALFRRADKNRDGRIDFSEFQRLVQPTDNSDHKVLGNLSQRRLSRQRSSPKNWENDSVIRNDRLPYTNPFNLQNSSRLKSPLRRESPLREESPRRHDSPWKRASPRRRESPTRREFLQARKSSKQRASPRDREGEYYQYLKQTPRISPSPSRKNIGSPRQKKLLDKKPSPLSSPNREARRQSPRNRSKSPSLKKEVTTYRIDSAFRTVKKFDFTPNISTPTDSLIHGKASSTLKQSSNARSPRATKRNLEDSSSRSKSPKFKTDITDYRVTSNFRTVKTFENPDETMRTINSPQRDQATTSNIYVPEHPHERPRSPRSSRSPRSPMRRERLIGDAVVNSPNSSANKSVKQKSPKFRIEPTYYREEAALRTVKVFENQHPQHSKDDFTGSHRGLYSPHSHYDINKRLEYY
mgnify:CR=1 FL=1